MAKYHLISKYDLLILTLASPYKVYWQEKQKKEIIQKWEFYNTFYKSSGFLKKIPCGSWIYAKIIVFFNFFRL